LDLATLSHADLVAELLSPSSTAWSGDTCRVNDAARAYGVPAALEPTLDHKLGVARELLLRELKAQMCRGPVMDSPQTLRDWLRLYCTGLEHEVFLVLYLNAQHALIEVVQMFRGTLTQTSVYPREVVKGALEHNAAAVVLAHNHPTGHAEPSRADEFLTQTLKSALALVDVRVLDHMVVGGDVAISFAERGLL
jgi:DNA repair protein RadC